MSKPALPPDEEDSSANICLIASDLTEIEASAKSIRALREHRQALEESEEKARSQLAEIGAVYKSAPVGLGVFEQGPSVFRTGEPQLNVEFSGTTPSQPGVERQWVEQWLPLKDSSWEVIAINVVAEEITQRKKAKEVVAAAHTQVQGIIDNTTSIVHAFDLQERLLLSAFPAK